MIFGVILILVSLLLFVLGLLIRKGNFDILQTYHRNQDYSKEAYRKAVGFSFIFASVVLMAAGIGAFFMNATLQVLLLAPAILLSVLPLWVVLKKFNH